MLHVIIGSIIVVWAVVAFAGLVEVFQRPTKQSEPFLPTWSDLRSAWRSLRAGDGWTSVISGLLFWGCVLFVIVAAIVS